jgi:hypothetical protein
MSITMSEPVFVTKQGQELTSAEATQSLLARVTKLEEQVLLNTKVLREILNQLNND